MKEIILNNKKNGMLVLLLTLALYAVAVLGLVVGINFEFVPLIVIAAIVLAVIFVIIPLILLCINRFSIKFNVEDNETVVVEYGIGCNEPQITATYTASILKFMNKDLKVTKEGDYDINAYYSVV